MLKKLVLLSGMHEGQFSIILSALDIVSCNSNITGGQVAAELNMDENDLNSLVSSWGGMTLGELLHFGRAKYLSALLVDKPEGFFSTAANGRKAAQHRIIPAGVDEIGQVGYYFVQSPFGKMVVAHSKKGICCAGFCSDESNATSIIRQYYPKAVCTLINPDCTVEKHLSCCENAFEHAALSFHVYGTPFQLAVWQQLLQIPCGAFLSYGQVAKKMQLVAGASRAVGAAIGSNPVTLLIPCHRVINENGRLSGYLWGTAMKRAIICYEFYKCSV